MYKIDPFGLLNRAFGIGRERLIRHYRVGENAISPSGSSDYTLQEIEVLEGEVTSYFGTPVITPVTIQSGRYPERGEGGAVNFVEYPEYQFPHTTLIEINRPKVIRKTEVSGQAGSRKEYYNAGDFRLRMRGLIVNQNSDYPPEEGIRALSRICHVPKELSVECELLEWMGVGNVVIENHSIFQLEGFSHVVGFDITLESDFTPEVRIRQGL